MATLRYVSLRVKNASISFSLFKNGDFLLVIQRYYDTATDWLVVIGKHASILVVIPHEIDDENNITPITIHATSRQQINYRVKGGVSTQTRLANYRNLGVIVGLHL